MVPDRFFVVFVLKYLDYVAHVHSIWKKDRNYIANCTCKPFMRWFHLLCGELQAWYSL